MDPLAEKYYSISPYAYCLNNPLKFADKDGRNPVVPVPVGAPVPLPMPNNPNAMTGSDLKANLETIWEGIKIVFSLTVENAFNFDFGPAAATPLGRVVNAFSHEASSNEAGESSSKEKKERTANDGLRKGKHGEPVPDDEAKGTKHTQLGTRDGKKEKYRQGREFDEKGNPVTDTDHTDHGYPKEHTNPHQHDWENNSTGGSKKRGDARPLRND